MTEVICIGERKIGLDELVDHRLAARILGLAPRTVQDMGTGSKRVLPVYRIGSRTNRFLVRDLLEWSEQRREWPEDAA